MFRDKDTRKFQENIPPIRVSIFVRGDASGIEVKYRVLRKARPDERGGCPKLERRQQHCNGDIFQGNSLDFQRKCLILQENIKGA